MKYILLIGDGMGDTPIAELGNKTPLAAAATPVMDRLCAAARPMMVRTVPPGYPLHVGSEEDSLHEPVDSEVYS